MLGEFKTDLLIWLSTILDHWGSLATGGILVAILALAREKFPKYFGWQTAWKVGILFLSFAIFQSWQQEYKSRVGREHDLVYSNHRIDSLYTEMRFQEQRLTSRCDQKEAVTQTLQTQNRSQQASINGCLSQAIKLLSPEPQKTTVLFLDSLNPFIGSASYKPGAKIACWLLLTNKPVTPVNMRTICDSPLENVTTQVVGSGFQMGGERRVSSNEFEVNLGSPAWTPSTPLVITTQFSGEAAVKCGFPVK